MVSGACYCFFLGKPLLFQCSMSFTIFTSPKNIFTSFLCATHQWSLAQQVYWCQNMTSSYSLQTAKHHHKPFCHLGIKPKVIVMEDQIGEVFVIGTARQPGLKKIHFQGITTNVVANRLKKSVENSHHTCIVSTIIHCYPRHIYISDENTERHYLVSFCVRG